MKAVVAMNDAVGLRFMHHEDVGVGMWISGLNIRHIRQSDDHGPRVAYIGEGSPEELKVCCTRLSHALHVLGKGEGVRLGLRVACHHGRRPISVTYTQD